MARGDVLMPTYNRGTSLAIVLTSLLGQAFTGFDVIVSGPTESRDADNPPPDRGRTGIRG